MISNLRRNAARVAMASIAVMSLAAGCESDDKTPQVPGPITQVGPATWVAIEPTQCLTNDWEADWLAQHGNDYAAYPKDYARPGLEPEEVAIIKDYYRHQGVVVSGTATAPKYDAICAACNCPEGHTMFLRVRAEDVETMIGFGYRVESPPGED
jgi:hypothetical protein